MLLLLRVHFFPIYFDIFDLVGLLFFDVVRIYAFSFHKILIDLYIFFTIALLHYTDLVVSRIFIN